MHTNINKLRGKIAEKRISTDALAVKMGINPATFYRKMKADGLTFTVGQMHQIVAALGLTAEETIAIFLAQDSQ